MTDDRATELAALHAAGALDGMEQEELKQLLANDPQLLGSQLGDFKSVAALIGVVQSPPRGVPAGLKAKLLQRVAQPKCPPGASGSGPFYFIRENEEVWQ